MSKIYAIDFETYYDKEYSLSNLSYWQYVHSEKFDPYLVAVWGDDVQFSGPPSEFKEWHKLDGAIWLMHNAHFDDIVTQRAMQLGIMPKITPKAIYDTADMAAYLKLPRSLAEASRVLLGKNMDKGMRNYMKGKTWAQACAAGKEAELREYGSYDAQQTKAIWDAASHRWPENERRVSIANRNAGYKGVFIDRDRADKAVTHMNTLMGELEETIPWEWGPGTDWKTPLAPTQIHRHCREEGIKIPSTLAKNKEEFLEWEALYADKYPWVKALGAWRSLNMLTEKVKNLRGDVRPDGTFAYQCKYFGAHTGRMSGGGGESGFNIQNLPRKPMHGVDLRAMILPRPGKKLVLIDYAQIEARALLWVVGDHQFIDIIKREGNLYQADAKRLGLYDGKDLAKDMPDLYMRFKVKRLSLGFGCGDTKYQRVAKLSYGVTLTDEQATHDVQSFRAENPKITALWRQLQNLATLAAFRKENLDITLPSGRTMTYYNVVRTHEGLKAMFIEGDPKSYRKIYGGLLTENLIQALCRDIFVDGWLALLDAGYVPLFGVHDEHVLELEDPFAHEEKLKNLLLGASAWANGCPLGLDFKVVSHYTK